MIFDFGRKQQQREIEALREEIAQIKASATHQVSTGVYGSELYGWLTDNPASSAGKVINEHTAMCVSAVYACVRLIGGAIAGLPLPIYRRTPQGRERIDHDVWWLLNEQPITRLSSAVFWEYLSTSLLLHGDAFARIIRKPKSPDIAGFEPIHPLCVSVIRYEDRLQYLVQQFGMPPTVYDQDDMLHVPGIVFDGLRGMSPLRYALKTSVGIALAADEYSASFFSNGARPDFAIKSQGKFTEEQADLLRKTWHDRYGGSSKAHLPAVLSGGLEVQELTMTSEDAQLIATRQFQVEDIARAYGVPPHMLGHTDKSTSWGTGIESMSIGFVKYTLRPYLTKIEKEINRKCFITSRFFAEFNVDGLMEGDSTAQSAYFAKALGGPGSQGWMTVNEIRRLKNLPPLPGYDDVAQAGAAPMTGNGGQNEPAQTTGG